MKENRSKQYEFFDVVETPIGRIYLLFASSTLIGISFIQPFGILIRKSPKAKLVKKELTEYFYAGRMDFTLETAFVEGTEFERIVWHTLKKVPYGETRTYKWLAHAIDKPHSFRAVGNALGKNPIPIIFPCHRIIDSDGSIGGYSSGIDVKRRLLELEYYTKLSKH